MYQLAIFDLDGTILYTLEDLADSVNHALSTCGLPTHDINFIEQALGNGLANLIHDTAPSDTPKEVEERALLAFQEHYAKHCMDKTVPYDGIPELFSNLRKAGMQICVLSNKRDRPVKELIAHYFPNLCDAAYGERPGIKRKPEPDAIWQIAQEFSLPLEDIVYIGDSEVDIQAAKNASVDCIAVEWGYRSYAHLVRSGAQTIVSDVDDLADLLLP